ncbi:bifunctional 4-hydroxy-2-oxoglutarate aldolase/2-dehydro-3-deoxy-phosphogluconate aldolase [Microbacterium sp. NPDC096154]|uniref:bifunctional 4-hydroxy-2-oxoglutarate aldolase/2-dehydro-3-deoxy-phosphogluconate aldolase n=1 Tax=Microbacterium sp. NPDC096154 TaxID=3155549 RepID=UPI003325DFCE
MVTTTELLARLRAERLMPIIRSERQEDAAAIGRALLEAGCTVLEVSLTTPGALDVIAELREFAPGLIGAGTVLTASDVASARDAGAEFMVTPAVTESIDASVRLDIPVLAGALTPTEILAAHGAGASAVKLFPAELGGPAYFSALRAPLPHIPLIPVGGVTLEMGRDYLARGALALGVGSPLTGRASDPVDPAVIAERATAFQRMVAEAR